MQRLQSNGSEKESEIQTQEINSTSVLDFSMRYGFADPLGPRSDITETEEDYTLIIHLLKQGVECIKIKARRFWEKLF